MNISQYCLKHWRINKVQKSVVNSGEIISACVLDRDGEMEKDTQKISEMTKKKTPNNIFKGKQVVLRA